MRKPKRLVLIALILIFGTISNLFGQENDKHFRNIVLKKGIIDSLFIFNSSKGKYWNETQLEYLGTLKSNDGEVFKILNYCWLWGRSPRATNRILIYDINNLYLGCYAPDLKDELPVEIKHNELIFSVKDGEGLRLMQTRVSFTEGLPRQIAIQGGNLYNLQRD